MVIIIPVETKVMAVVKAFLILALGHRCRSPASLLAFISAFISDVILFYPLPLALILALQVFRPSQHIEPVAPHLLFLSNKFGR
jgi:hypothetical protein